MDIILYIIVSFIIVRLLLSFIAAPIMLHAKEQMHASPRFDLFDPNSLPRDKAEYFAAKLQLLEKEGFEPLNFVSWESHENRRILFALAVHRKNRDTAVIALATSGIDKKPLEIRYTEFSAVFTDGSEICSSNNPLPDVLKQIYKKKVFSFPQVKDLHHLYILHRRLTARFALGKEAVLPPNGKEIQALELSTARSVERQVAAGYFRSGEKGEILRPTWKGAFFMSWKLAWPLGFIRSIFYRKKINTLIRQLLVSDTKSENTPAPRIISEQIIEKKEEAAEKKTGTEAEG